MDFAAGTRLSHYEVIGRLGTGSMGEVWRARDTRLERDVALKFPRAEFASDEHRRARFEREAKAISKLAHERICTVYDVSAIDGCPYLVMEYLEGETLADRIEGGALSLDDVVRYGSEICEALDCAHAAGIFHRDLKPANVMLTPRGAKLFDFGLAKQSPLTPDSDAATVERALLTRDGAVVGTMMYAAPEQIRAERLDARADIFALGAVLYEMATGKRAFQSASDVEAVAAILSADPPSLDGLKDLPLAFGTIVRRCLSKERELRWQCVRDLRYELIHRSWREPAAEQLNKSAVRATSFDSSQIQADRIADIEPRFRFLINHLMTAQERFSENERQQALIQQHLSNMMMTIESEAERLLLGEIVADYDDCSLLTRCVEKLGVGDELVGLTDWETDRDWWKSDDAQSFLLANERAIKNEAFMKRIFVYDETQYSKDASFRELIAEMDRNVAIGVHVRSIERRKLSVNTPELRSQCVLRAHGDGLKGPAWLTYRVELDVRKQPLKNIFSIKSREIETNERLLDGIWRNASDYLGPQAGSLRNLRVEAGRDDSGAQNCGVLSFGTCDEPDDVLSPLQIVPEGVKDGRRLYIHEGSFDDLALQGRDAATLIYSGLVALPVIKLVHHDLVEEGVAIEQFDKSRARALEEAIGNRWFDEITHAFRRIGVRPSARSGKYAVTSLLELDESIVATCLDASYYTFATTDRAAERMYSDVLKLSKVWQLVRQRTDAYRDLTMVKGRHLTLMDARNASEQPRTTTQARPSAGLSALELESIKRQILAEFKLELAQIIQVTIPTPSFAEAQRLSEFQAKCVTAVRDAVLHLKAT